ncbi:MAG: recombinase family protein [Candidatus Saccharimonadales bacterium]
MSKEVLAVALCRVSSIEQLENNSLGHQKGNVLKEAERLGARIPDDAVWEGAVSSKKGVNYNRKDLKEIEEYCKKNRGVRYLIVQEVDRFMRSPDEQTYWYVKFFYELNVQVWFADKPELNEDTHNASLFRFLEGWRAGGSNEERKSKSINGQTAALKEGRYTFHPKPGYERGEVAGIHKIHPVSGLELQKVLRRLAAGYVNATNALIELNKSKFTENHAPYKMDKFRKIATDIYYAGILEMDRQVQVKGVKGLHEPIISLEEHNRLVDIFNNKPKYQTGPKRRGNPLFPLNNIMEDDACVDLKNKGRLVGFKHSNGKYKKFYEKYRCRTCGRYWHKDELHNKVADLFDRYEMSSDTQSKIIDALEIVWQKDSESRIQEVGSMKRAIRELETYIEQKVESATDDSNSSIKGDILKIIEKKKEELVKLNVQLRKLTEQEEDDRKEFMVFALAFIQDTGKHFLEPYVSKENRLVCKQMLFPAGIYINPDEKVYTPEVSVFFRGEAKKKDAEASDNSHLVRVRGL